MNVHIPSLLSSSHEDQHHSCPVMYHMPHMIVRLDLEKEVNIK
jgi:hypothetical protein